MTGLSHIAAFEFVRRVGLVVPTEAQWEHAARGGSLDQWWWGSDPSQLPAHEVVNRAPSAGPEVIGSASPNPFGLYDVLGNLRELTRDPYSQYAVDSPRDPRDGMYLGIDPDRAESFTARGGFYMLDYDESPRQTGQLSRCSMRLKAGATDTMPISGLRPARTLDQDR